MVLLGKTSRNKESEENNLGEGQTITGYNVIHHEKATMKCITFVST